MEQKFFVCKHCGNIIGMIHSSGVPIVCCGEKMSEMQANTSDGATEKHVPVIKVEGNKVVVEVGSVAHPMVPEHFIPWICLVTSKGRQRKQLNPGDKPQTVFFLEADEKVIEAYEYCNIHGLWKKTL
ncbi:MAG: desulfoferrodoxin family protein [Candidatus Riflebacteria bacterium]|nr:desulfoferrodoxin family protein [Candidatus Riflebacteria bacterium]